MLRLGVVLLVAVAALAGSASADTPVLTATVGPAFNISLTDATGAKVSHLDPGTYVINVSDKSDEHNFDLTGPGVSKSTGVTDVVDAVWTVTFTNGTYRYLCDVHSTIMKGSFTVG